MLARSRGDSYGETLSRQPLGCFARRDPGRLGLLVDAAERVADAGDLALEPVGVPAEPLEPDPVQRAAAVDDVIRRVEDSGSAQALAVRGCRELVVGAAGDDAAAEPRNRVGIQRRAERAGRVDVAFQLERSVGIDRVGARRARPLLVDVADEDDRTRRRAAAARASPRPSPCPGRAPSGRPGRRVRTRARASPGCRGRRRAPCGRSDRRNRRCRRYGRRRGAVRPPITSMSCSRVLTSGPVT